MVHLGQSSNDDRCDESNRFGAVITHATVGSGRRPAHQVFDGTRSTSLHLCALRVFYAVRIDDVIALSSMRFGVLYNGAALLFDLSVAVDGVIMPAFQGATEPYPPHRVVSQPPSAGSREDATM